MRGCFRFFAGLTLSVFLLIGYSAAQPGEPSLKPGDMLPPLAGQALTEKWLDVTSDVRGKPVVVVFSFTRAGGSDAQLWTQRLTRDNPNLAVYNVIFLESVPRLFRGMAVSGIKSGMPSALHGRTVLLYRDEDLWKHRLQVANERDACVMLLGTTSREQWITTGPFSDALYSELGKSLRALN